MHRTFTQHGFRYVEVSGLGAPLAMTQVEAIEMHTAISQVSAVSTSLPMLNAIQHATLWGQKSNIMSVPTDCPNRDERRGWTGDASLTAEEALYNYGMGAIYTRWLDEIVDDQTADGSVNNFVPSLGEGDGAPNWQSAYPSIIWGLYMYYGDTTIVTRHYSSLSKYYDHLEANFNASAGLTNYVTGFGDWVPAGPMGNKHLIGSFALLADLQKGADFFGASSHPDGAGRAQRCKDLFAKAAADFHRAFFNATMGYYGTGLQTEQAMPLYLGIVPAGVLPAVISHTISDIEVTHQKHTTSGIIGIKAMLDALTAAGRTDVALDMLMQVECQPPVPHPIHLHPYNHARLLAPLPPALPPAPPPPITILISAHGPGHIPQLRLHAQGRRGRLGTGDYSMGALGLGLAGTEHEQPQPHHVRDRLSLVLP